MSSFSKRLFAAAVFVALLAPASFAANSPTDVIAKVNGKTITRENLDVATSNLLPLMTYHQSVSDERMKEIRNQALEKLINNELMYKAAVETKQDDVNQKEIDARIKDLKKKLPKGETIEKVLKRSGMTLADLKEDFKKDMVVEKIAKKKNEEVRKASEKNVDEAFMKDYYQKNLTKFKEPEQIHLRSILVKADPSGGQRVWNESLKKAKDLAEKAKAGDDFAKLAEKNSEDPYAKKGGDMGWSHKGELIPEIDDAASKLKVGEIGGPIMSIYGYHVIKLEGNKPSVQKKFDELNKVKLEKELEAKEYKRLWDGWLKSLRDSSKVEYVTKIN
ncbi:MAG: peptidylprolyl isomerase [Deltaproteobacteria bacterium]|nr:peptidylprolyl isomerase [Deltaproteobacteria bacterium]